MSNHHLECEAPICKDDPNPNFKHAVKWYAGEDVCTKSPYTKWQKKQIDINKWVKLGKFRNLEILYTAYELETKSI